MKVIDAEVIQSHVKFLTGKAQEMDAEKDRQTNKNLFNWYEGRANGFQASANLLTETLKHFTMEV